jgi:sterol 3beta-glucosyltransferase
LGVGPAPIDHRRLTVDNLSEAIDTMTTDQAMRCRATELGTQLRAEDGVARAVEIIARYLEENPR